MAQNFAETEGSVETLQRLESTETLDGLETALSRALSEADSDEARYQIRTALQKVEVLHEIDGNDPP